MIQEQFEGEDQDFEARQISSCYMCKSNPETEGPCILCQLEKENQQDKNSTVAIKDVFEVVKGQ